MWSISSSSQRRPPHTLHLYVQSALACVLIACGEPQAGVDAGSMDADSVDAGAPIDTGPGSTDAATETDAMSSDAGMAVPIDGGPHRQNLDLAAIEPGTALDLGRYECTEQTGFQDCSSISDYSGLVYDSDRHQMLMFGGGHASTARTDVAVFSFDTLDWQSAYPSTPCESMRAENYHRWGQWADTGHPLAIHTYDRMVYFQATQKMVLFGNYREGQGARVANTCVDWVLEPGPDTRAHIYDPSALTWAISSLGPQAGDATEFDPRSGRALLIDSNTLAFYDPSTDTLQDLEGPSIAIAQGDGSLTFSPTNDRFYYISTFDWRASTCPELTPPYVLEFSLDRSAGTYEMVNLAGAMTGELPNFGCAGQGEKGFVLDPVQNELITLRNGAVYAFDPLTHDWRSRPVESISESGETVDLQYFAIGYDPVDGVFILNGGPYNNRHVWAYRHTR